MKKKRKECTERLAKGKEQPHDLFTKVFRILNISKTNKEEGEM